MSAIASSNTLVATTSNAANSSVVNPMATAGAVAKKTAPESSPRLPDATTLQNAVKLAIQEDKPVMLDYWAASLQKEVIVGVRNNNEKLLVKSSDEYTSPIQKIFKVGGDFIIMTENSLYLVDAGIPSKRISS